MVKFWSIFSLAKIIANQEEPWLEKWARLLRFGRSLFLVRHLLQTRDKITVLDIGCGQATQYYKYLQYFFPNDLHRIEYLGIDPLLKVVNLRHDSARVITETYESFCQKTTQHFDLITAFAVLEHVDQPQQFITSLSKLLKSDAYLIGTTPTFVAKPVLEFFAHGLGIISVREIAEHKQYFNRRTLGKILSSITSESASINYHAYFEFGLNNVFVIRKQS